MDDTKLARFAELAEIEDDLDDQLKAVRKEKAALEAELIEEFLDTGIQRVNVNGRTIYLRKQIWASVRDGNKRRACDVLRAEGLDELIEESFNTGTLSAYVREQIERADEIEFDKVFSPSFLEGINVTERASLRTLKSQ